MKTKLLTFIFLFGAIFSFAQTEITYDDPDCPKAKPLRGICNHVIDPEDHDGEQIHIKKLKDAACVRPGDSPEVEGIKIRAMWDKYEDKLVCDSIAFSVIGGNIIKATLLVKNKDFMETLMDWKVNLNRVDPADQRTVMDYIRDELNKNPPPYNKQFLEGFYRRLKNKGAKHRTELEAGSSSGVSN